MAEAKRNYLRVFARSEFSGAEQLNALWMMRRRKAVAPFVHIFRSEYPITVQLDAEQRMALSNAGAGFRICEHDEDRIAQLPAPVYQYFRAVLRNKQPMVTAARITHEGEFCMNNNRWFPFSSTEVFSTKPPGFIWDARIRLAAGIPVRVLDKYADDAAFMSASLFGIVPIVNVSGSPELAAGALQRYLAEAVWFPTALLPCNGVHWDDINSFAASATLTHGDISVSLEFQFNAVGEITGAFTPFRNRYVEGAWHATPWKCRYENYVDREGMRIPLEGEVEWQLADGPLPYWRGRVTDVAYDFVEIGG